MLVSIAWYIPQDLRTASTPRPPAGELDSEVLRASLFEVQAQLFLGSAQLSSSCQCLRVSVSQGRHKDTKESGLKRLVAQTTKICSECPS
jgi:hypothetical protein